MYANALSNLPEKAMNRRIPFRLDVSIVLALAFLLIGQQTLNASPYSQGRLAFARGDFDSAMRLLEESTRSDPSNGNAYFYIGLIHERKGRKPQSIQAYKQAVSRRMDADLREKALWKIVLYSKYIGDWGSVSVYSSQFLKYKHHPEMARLQAMAANQGGSSSAEMVRLVQKGQKSEKEGNLTEAIGYYEEAIDIEPDAHSVRWNLASVAMKANQYSRAVTHLKYLDRKDSQWKYSYKLGVCYYQLGKYQSALSFFDRATSQNNRPSGSFKYFLQIGRGLTYLELEDIVRAEENLNSASRVKNSALVQGALARIALMKGDRNTAASRMQAALKEDSSQLDALSVRALLTSDPDNYEKFQDQLYRNTVYQPAYYNSVTLQYVHVLADRSRFDRARTVLDSLSNQKIEAVHKMKYNTAALSNRALIFSSTSEEQKASAGVSRSRLLEEEIQMFLLFDRSDRAKSAIARYKEELANTIVDEKTEGNSPSEGQSRPEPEPEPESQAGWLRAKPEIFEYIARVELLDFLFQRKDVARATEVASFWVPRSSQFKTAAADLSEVQSLISRDAKWAALFGEKPPTPETVTPSPETSPGPMPESDNDSPAPEKENTEPENPASPEAETTQPQSKTSEPETEQENSESQ